jgi:acetolactate synthase-1/2/3 large subunit
MGYADPALNRAALRAFQQSDCVLIIGKRLDYRLAFGGRRLFSPGARFIQIDIHSQELGMNRALDVAICADAKAALRGLREAWSAPERPASAWLETVRALRREWEAELARRAQDSAGPPHPAAFFRELKQALPHDILYSWDGGDFAHWGRASLQATQGGGWLRLGPLGVIGASLPNGIALQLAHPGRPVTVITGDGAFGFYIAELDTAVRHKLPIVVIVGNDAGWGLERELQSEANPGGETIACELRRTRYDIVMQGFGGGGETIDRLDQVRPAVDRAFASGIPYCLNVNIRGVRSPFTEWQIMGKKS